MNDGSAVATSIPPPLAATLGQFAYGLRRDQIAEPATEHAALLILDAVGCALAGWMVRERRRCCRWHVGWADPGSTRSSGTPSRPA